MDIPDKAEKSSTKLHSHPMPGNLHKQNEIRVSYFPSHIYNSTIYNS